jgi:hypothetical protein
LIGLDFEGRVEVGRSGFGGTHGLGNKFRKSEVNFIRMFIRWGNKN